MKDMALVVILINRYKNFGHGPNIAKALILKKIIFVYLLTESMTVFPRLNVYLVETDLSL